MVLIQRESSVEKNCCHVIHIDEGENGVNLTAGSFAIEILTVLRLHDSKWILCLITYNTVIIYYLYGWITSTNSIALNAYANTIIFNIFALLVCLISVWVSRNSSLSKELHDSKLSTMSTLGHLNYFEYGPTCSDGIVNSPAANFVDILNTKDNVIETPSNGRSSSALLSILGVERYEVQALFVSSCLILTFSVSISIKIIQRLAYQPNIHTARLGLGAIFGILGHLGTILVYPDATLNHVVCTALPCPTWNGCNPILAGNIISGIILFITHIVIHFWDLHIADTVAAFVIISLSTTSMLPLALQSSNVILQKVPNHMTVQLNRLLREALDIDGVIEFRNEKFWTKSFGKLAGRLYVRIRRNTNENYVLENITKHLSKIVPSLNVYEYHDPQSMYQRTSINSMASAHPPEYYIDEILPRVKNTNLPRCNDKFTSLLDQQHVKVTKIDEVLKMKRNNNNTMQLGTFAKGSSSSSSGSNIHTVTEELAHGRDDKFTTSNFHRDERTMRLATIFWNENVTSKDHLYRE